MFDQASVISSSFQVTEQTSLLSTDVPRTFLQQWPQHLAAILASMIAMSSGCVAGWSAPAIPYLQGNLGNLDINPITDSQASWVGSIITLGALTGAIPAGKLAGVFGRKWFLIFLAFPLVFGWLIIIYGYRNVYLIYCGRFICGLSFGAVTVAVPMYNNEIASDNVRGVIGVYFDLMWCVGILWVYVVGAYTSFFWLSLSSCCMPIFFILTFICMPESPVYLLVSGDKEAAESSLRWLRRGKNVESAVTAETIKIQRMIDEAQERSSKFDDCAKVSDFKTFRMRIKYIFGSTTAKAVIIGFGLMTFQRLSGVSAVVYYTVDIFRGANTTVAPETATIIVGVVAVVASSVSAIFVDRLGRKALLILSGIAMSLSLAVLTVYFILKSYGIKMDLMTSIPVIALCFFIAAFRIGYGSIPWLMAAEILPNEVKLWAYSFIVCFAWLLTFLVTKLYPILVNILGYHFVYGILCFINFLGVLFVLTLVPETKCKTSVEIQEELEKRFCSRFATKYESIESN
ncbi:trehalose transporter 1-like protein [Lycorma delicatula]|uniref:trehalose transporter 1-like protein n=1 Tax=Lycorma delicatula TaxID=130591 RepID=UPI003F5164C2